MVLPIWSYLIVVALGLLLIYHFTYLKRVDNFETSKPKSNVVLDTSKDATMFPYTTSPINSLDQYELEAVFDNEGDRELKQQQINQMTRRYPLDWSNLPPNSSKFQSGQAKYIEGFSAKASAENPEEAYKAIGDGNLVPPDTLEMEKQEKKIQ